ncbi:hypothetical protein [Bradyrhizobium sp. 2TAF24]
MTGLRRGRRRVAGLADPERTVDIAQRALLSRPLRGVDLTPPVG